MMTTFGHHKAKAWFHPSTKYIWSSQGHGEDPNNSHPRTLVGWQPLCNKEKRIRMVGWKEGDVYGGWMAARIAWGKWKHAIHLGHPLKVEKWAIHRQWTDAIRMGLTWQDQTLYIQSRYSSTLGRTSLYISPDAKWKWVHRHTPFSNISFCAAISSDRPFSTSLTLSLPLHTHLTLFWNPQGIQGQFSIPLSTGQLVWTASSNLDGEQFTMGLGMSI